jgi:hypothetical protein
MTPPESAGGPPLVCADNGSTDDSGGIDDPKSKGAGRPLPFVYAVSFLVDGAGTETDMSSSSESSRTNTSGSIRREGGGSVPLELTPSVAEGDSGLGLTSGVAVREGRLDPAKSLGFGKGRGLAAFHSAEAYLPSSECHSPSASRKTSSIESGQAERIDKKNLEQLGGGHQHKRTM